MKREIETLQESNKLATEKHQAEVKQLKIEHAVESALHGAGAKNLRKFNYSIYNQSYYLWVFAYIMWFIHEILEKYLY